jgi:hypothetical protein
MEKIIIQDYNNIKSKFEEINEQDEEEGDDNF